MNIEIYKQIVIQIATPWGTGTGFYLKAEDIIVTNNHVLNGAREVVISGNDIKKQLAKVVFTDSIFDLAFLEAPKNIEFPSVSLSEKNAVTEGNQILAIGHPYGLEFTATQGIVSKSERNWNNINYIQIDAAINPGNSGGPLIDEDNNIIGVNTFILSEGQNLGFALPVKYLKEAIEEYKGNIGSLAVKCRSCSNLITAVQIEDDYCPHCGVKIEREEFEGKKYVPSYAGNKIEQIIEKLKYDVKLSRVGINFWEIDEGSARIILNYNPKTRYLVAYSTLCRLPKQNIGDVYEYLLDQNNVLKGLSFSIRDQDIILSSMYIYDEDIHIESGVELHKNLFLKADHYDDILIDMGCITIKR